VADAIRQQSIRNKGARHGLRPLFFKEPVFRLPGGRGLVKNVVRGAAIN